MALKPQEFPGNIIADHGYIYSGSQINVVNQDSPTADQETPILLSAHHYWNFEAYQETQDLSGHYARIDSSKIIATDGLLIPNGSYVDACTNIVAHANSTRIGLDDVNTDQKPAFSLWSVNSGIKFEVTTNQPALQMYSCNGIYNASLPIPRKQDQGGPSTFYNDHTCAVVEQESHSNGINNPDYPVNEIY